jgi:hypothetical protein
MVVPPQIAAIILASIAQDFGMMRNEYRLMVLI